MKTGMVAYTFYEDDNRVRRYAEALAKRGDEVEVIAARPRGQAKEGVLKGVRVFRIYERLLNEKGKSDYFIRTTLFLLASFLKVTLRHLRRPYDVLHIHSIPDYEVFAALIPRLTGTKIILDIHDLVPELFAGKFKKEPNHWMTKILRSVEKMCCSFSHHVIISNDLWRDRIVTRSVREEKCTALLNYPDSSIFNPDPPLEKNNSDAFICLYPGSLNYHQGVDIAVKACSLIQIPNLEFHIYGYGPLWELLEKQIREFNLQQTVFLHDIVSLEEIAAVMGSADLGIVPKRAEDFGNEAFSTKTLEFMMLGVPIILSETRIDKFYYNHSLVEFFKSGNEMDLAKKITYLYGNPHRRNELIENGKAYAEQNIWERKKQLYFDIVDAIPQKNKARIPAKVRG
ncbi:MAG: glycosyltransferase [Chitinivibrionales bacterium]|nr:glycosyltransferase [Chitinivibrionales bacterium]